MTGSLHGPRPDPDALERLLDLIGEEVCVLRATWPPEGRIQSDIDCAVRGIDLAWPLRLREDQLLIQHRGYDLNSWLWIVETEGQLVWFDCIQDPRGIGRYKFPTSLIRCAGGRLPEASVRAAYMTLKKLRKGVTDPEQWASVRLLAAHDQIAYREILRPVVGRNLERKISLFIEGSSSDPSPRLRKRVRAASWVRRFRDPLAALTGLRLGVVRWVSRFLYPTGLRVTLAGPDGTGKSTVAAELPKACRGAFLRYRHAHWRPGLLPPLGRLKRSAGGNPARPHGRPPKGGAASGRPERHEG